MFDNTSCRGQQSYGRKILLKIQRFISNYISMLTRSCCLYVLLLIYFCERSYPHPLVLFLICLFVTWGCCSVIGHKTTCDHVEDIFKPE